MQKQAPFLLNLQSTSFPNPRFSNEDGLLAIGGDLSPDRLLQAYSQGIFPWYEANFPIMWWSPDPRLVLIPQHFKLSNSLKKSLNKPYSFTIDTAFSTVIEACSSTNGRRNRTWITREMINAYIQLHTLGFAHSFEVWLEDELVGGLYGISLGRAFFGESMFHLSRDSSKLAMYFLCETLIKWKFDFIDCQLATSHLQSLGAEVISREKFLKILQATLHYPTLTGSWAII